MKISRRIAAVFLAAALAIGTAGCGCQKEEDVSSSSDVGQRFSVDANVVTDERADLDQMLEEMQKKVDEGTIDLEVQNEIIVEDGNPAPDKPVGSGLLSNKETNRYPVIITITEGDETIFQSGLIPVGGRIEKIKFNQALSPGDHACVATYTLLNEETQEAVGAASFELTVKVLN